MLNLKNALRCATANLLMLACALLPTQRALADCSDTHSNGNDIFLNDNGTGVSNSSHTFAPDLDSVGGGTNETVTSCASGSGGVAVGHLSFAGGQRSVALGLESTTANEATESVAIGHKSYVGIANRPVSGVGGTAGIAIGARSRVGDAHIDSVALGKYARTTARHQFVFGTSVRTFAIGIDSQGRRIANRTGGLDFALSNATTQSTYRFAGLAIAEDDLAGISTARITGNFGTTDATRKAEYDKVVARDAEVAAAREAAANRVLGVNGHGDLVALGNVGEFMGGGSGMSYDDAEVRGLIGNNRDAISGLNTRVEKASQGVALSNALASLPKALLPGERLRLGIGVGSFDGKSGTAIGVMGKFGASTLLNAGFSSGGGETSTRAGISWEW